MNKHFLKRGLGLLLCIIMALSLMIGTSAAELNATSTSGKCGDNVTWTLSSGGTLTLKGTGSTWDFCEEEMYDYHPCPWEKQKDKIKKVVVKEGVTRIGAMAFWACENLESVLLPDSLLEIDYIAFYYCEKLSSCPLPPNLQVLGQQCFSYTAITSTVIPASVKVLNNGYSDCKLLETVYIDGNAEIGNYTYWSSLFQGCTNLQRIDVSEDHPYLESINGVLFDGHTLVSFPNGRAGTSYRIPAGTALIYQGAFGEEFSHLKKLTIPSSVKAIRSLFWIESLSDLHFEGDVPETDGELVPFYPWDTMTVYYPKGNSTWSQYIKQYKQEAAEKGSSGVKWKAVELPTIVSQPIDKAQEAGKDVTFSVTAKGGVQSYQWYYRTDEWSPWKKVSADSGKTAKYTFTAAARHDGYQYMCEIANSEGRILTDVVTFRIGTPVKITTQPKDAEAAVGQSTSFKVAASGKNLSYQWYYRTSTSGVWKPVSAASGKTATFKLTPQEKHNGYQYRCKVTNDVGSVCTKTVTLTVLISKPTITAQPKNVSVTAGSTATFKVTAEGAASYQWYYRKTSSDAWTAVSAASGKTATFKLTAQARHNGYQYRCKVTNSAGSVYTSIVSLTVK